MAEVINLRQARKAKTRSEREAKANANRVAFGRTKAETMAVTAESERRERHLDGAERDPGV